MENFEIIKPMAIEEESFKIIDGELRAAAVYLDKDKAPIIKRVIHTTADFSYVDSLYFSDDVIRIAVGALKKGALIITDTNMAKAGINKNALKKSGGDILCFMSSEEVASEAKERQVTRAIVSMERAAAIESEKPLIIVVGNAPTALLSLNDLIKAKKFNPALVIGAPVGFVNVVESKELIMDTGVPVIVARGRKGGSNVAAAIVNALLYIAYPRD